MDTATPLVVARPPVLPSQTVRVSTALGTAFITLARDAQGQPFEVFLNVGKAGTDTFALSEALGRLISLILRLNAPASPEDRLREIATQLAYIGTTRSGGGQMSLPHALAKTLQGFLSELETDVSTASPVYSQPPQVEKATGRNIPLLDLQKLGVKGSQRKKTMSTETMTLPPAVLAATETLASTLAAAEPIAAYRRAQEHIESDPEARSLLERLSQAQANLRVSQSSGTVSQADIETLRALQHKVRSNHVIMEYAESQQNAMAYLPEINQEISQLLGLDFASLAGPGSC